MVIDLSKIQNENKRLKDKKSSKFYKKIDKLLGKKITFKKPVQNRVTIVIPKQEVKPILRRSELFNKEYNKEKLLAWK